MKLVWSAEELVEHWSVESEDWANPDTAGEAGCLGFVAQLTFYRMWARFPDGRADFGCWGAMEQKNRLSPAPAAPWATPPDAR
jgi:hypothetical protein